MCDQEHGGSMPAPKVPKEMVEQNFCDDHISLISSMFSGMGWGWVGSWEDGWQKELGFICKIRLLII